MPEQIAQESAARSARIAPPAATPSSERQFPRTPSRRTTKRRSSRPGGMHLRHKGRSAKPPDACADLEQRHGNDDRQQQRPHSASRPTVPICGTSFQYRINPATNPQRQRRKPTTQHDPRHVRARSRTRTSPTASSQQPSAVLPRGTARRQSVEQVVHDHRKTSAPDRERSKT